MDESNSNVEQPGLMARLGNWLKKEPTTGSVESSAASVRPRGPSTRTDLDAIERQLRKARLGEVRKSEFQDLRRSIGHSPIPKGSTFSLTSALVPNTSFLARARQNTRLKIDSIEEQISRSWFNSGLHKGSAITGLATRPGARSRPFKSSNQAEIKVELDGVMMTLPLPSEALNAATAYALGDFVTAEQVLIALTKKPEPLETAQISWDMLFEFYLALGRQAEFENLSVDFAARFGKSPPIWTDHWNPGRSIDVAPVVKNGGDSYDVVTTSDQPKGPFEVAGYLVSEDVEALTAHFDQAVVSGLWEVDWRKLSEVDVDALPGLIALMERVLSAPGEVHYLGASQLTDVLRRQTKIPELPFDVQKRLWYLVSMHLQLIGDHSQLEEVSFQYSILFEEILPTATTVASRYLPETPSELAEGSDPQTAPDGVAAAAPADMPENGFGVVDVEGRLVVVSGTLKGDIGQELGRLPLPTESQPLVFECKGFARLDSQAAGHLLGFLRSKKCHLGTVKLRGLNRLIGVYLFSFGLPQNVTLSFVTL